MRLAFLLSAAALALAAFNAAAQDAPPAPDNGLAGLANTLESLSDEEARTGAPVPAPAEPPAEAPAQPPSEPPAEPQVGAGAEPQPAAQAPVPDPSPPPTPAPRPPLVMPPEPLTRAQLAELQATATRGRLLGAIERSGRVATQDMLVQIPDPDGARISGWIAEAEGNGVAVTFYADSGAGPVTVYRGTINGGRIVSRDLYLTGTQPPLNPLQARMAAARAATAALDHRPCGSEAFNVFVVPPLTSDGAIDVYQVSPQTRPGHYPLGGHFRTSVAPDGSIVATRGYADTCADAAVAIPAPGTRPAPITITHVPDPLPQDIHVFLSAWTGHPVVVVAGNPQRAFAVTPEGIAEVPRAGPGR